MKEILEDVDRWRRGGDRVVLATVVATRRSAPRPPGAKLAVSSSGELAGSVSGGCVENDVYGRGAERARGRRAPPSHVRHLGRPNARDRSPVRRRDRRLCRRDRPATRRPPAPRYRRRMPSRALHNRCRRESGGEMARVDGEGTDAPGELAAEVDRLLRSGRSAVLEPDDKKVFAEVYEPPRASSSSGRSTRLKRSAQSRSSSAGGRLSPTRERSSRRVSGSRAPMSSSWGGPTRCSSRCIPTQRLRSSS